MRGSLPAIHCRHDGTSLGEDGLFFKPLEEPMAKTLEQRIAQLEKLITDFFTGGSPKTKSRRPAARKEKKAKPAKKSVGRKSRKSSRG